MSPTSLEPLASQVIAELLTTRGSKWTPHVVLHLRDSTLRFSELRRDIPGISQKTLTITLRGLERDGFVTRTMFATIPPRVDYALTDLGREVLEIFEAWERFAQTHWVRVIDSRRRFDLDRD
jgi:DNA-binding HxlR family transcriptional regulator